MMQTLMRGLNRHYYSIAINYWKNDFEMKMLINLNKVAWAKSLEIEDYKEWEETNNEKLKQINKLTDGYNLWI